MAPQSIAFRQRRVIELAEALHAEPLHDAPRALVGRDGEREDLLGRQIFEAEAQRLARAFRGQAHAPEVPRQSPANLDAGREVGVEDRPRQADHADALAGGSPLRAEEAEAEREKRAKIIASEGELLSASKLGDAAAIIAKNPIALQLRNLQVLSEIAVEKNSTIIFPSQFMDTVSSVKEFMSKEKIS